MYFVTDDNDYCSPLDNEKPDSFLSAEWEKRKNSSLVLYKRLSEFFGDKYPNIKLACEFEKELLINKLTGSHSFSQTHSVIAKLCKFHDFTPAQLNDIISAAISNDQVSSIIGDADVKEFITQAIAGNESMIEPDNLTSLVQSIKPDIDSEVEQDIDV